MSEDPLNPENFSSVSVQTEAPSRSEGSVSGNGDPRPHRRRRRRRRRGGRGGGPPGAGGGTPERVDDVAASGPERPAEGVLYIPPKENAPGVLVSAPGQLSAVPEGSPGAARAHQSRRARGRRPDHRFRGRRQPPGSEESRDRGGHGPRRLPPAAGVSGARLDRPHDDPEARDRSRRNVRTCHRPPDADRPRPALPDRGASEGRQDHVAEAHGPRRRGQRSRRPCHRAPDRRAARGDHGLPPERDSRRGHRVLGGPSRPRTTSPWPRSWPSAPDG